MKSTMHLTPADYLVVVGYFVLILAVGLWVKRTQATATDFFAGGHQIPWWMAGISHYMSTFSAFSFIVYSQMAYTYGWVAITIFWTGVPACILGGLVFAKLWRRARVITPIEFLEQRCNANIRQLYVWVGIPSKLFDGGLKIFATAMFLSVTVGLGLDLSILLCGGIIIAYTLSGGLFALVIADYVQFLMKTLAILLLLPLAILRGGGLHSAFSRVPPHLFHLTAPPYGALYVIGYGVVVVLSYNGNWALAQKYYSVSNERAASKAAYLSAALSFIGSPLMFLPAILARNFMPNLMAQGKTVDVYVLLLLALLPVGMIGIIVAAMFSATMAAVSSDVNAIASVLTKDWYQRMFNRDAKETTLLQVGRVFTALLGLSIMGMSFWLAHSHYESIFQLMVTVLGVLVVPTLLPVLCLLIWKRLSAGGVVCGLLSGLICGVCMVAIDQFLLHPRHLSENMLLGWQGFSILLNTVFTFAGMYVGSTLWPASGSEKVHTAQFFLKMSQPVQSNEIAQNTQVSHPGKIIGFTTCLIGLLLVAAGIISGVRIARTLDFACGAVLLAIGLASAWSSKASAAKRRATNLETTKRGRS